MDVRTYLRANSADILFVQFNDPMHNWNIPTINFEHDNFTNTNRFLAIVCKKQQIATMKGWLHTATEDNDNRRLTARDDHQTFPNHQGRWYDHTETKELIEKLGKKMKIITVHLRQDYNSVYILGKRLAFFFQGLWNFGFAVEVTLSGNGQKCEQTWRLSMRWTSPKRFSIVNCSKTPIVWQFFVLFCK